MMKKEIAAVLFDMDGVIMDSMPYHVLAWQEVLQEFGYQVSAQAILEHEGGFTTEKWLKQFVDRPDPGAFSQQDYVFASHIMRQMGLRQIEIFLPKYSRLVRPYSGVDRLLQVLQARGIPAALVTSSSRRIVEQILPLPIMESFRAIVASEDVILRKPNPDPYLQAAYKLEVKPSECLVVENSPYGIIAGLAAGATCVGISSTLPKNYLDQAHYCFSSMEELEKKFLANQILLH